MGSKATVAQAIPLWLAVAASLGLAQTAPDWRRVGNTALELNLADLGSGPVDRVGFSADGSELFIRTGLGRVYRTRDFETWEPLLEGQVPSSAGGFALTGPENGAQFRNPAPGSPRRYAFGRFVHRSDDEGRHWENRTGFRGVSLIGEVRDLAVSPRNEDDIAAATAWGVFRSLDGGLTWAGLNGGLANLPAARLREVPLGDRGAQIELSGATVMEWAPGEREAWRIADNTRAKAESDLRLAFGGASAIAINRNYIYVGLPDGRIRVSNSIDGPFIERPTGGGPVNAFWIDPENPQFALAVLGAREHSNQPVPPRIVHTLDGGVRWDDVSANLPDVSANGLTADAASNAVYVATDSGVFLTRFNVRVVNAPPAWSRIAGLPDARVSDARLGPGGHQLWVALEGQGIFATLAPHRASDPKIISTADRMARAAAPGALVSIAGLRVDAAFTGGVPAPVLGATPTESQIQIPFEATGNSVALAINDISGRRVLDPVPLQTAAPGILVEWEDGSPWLLDADTGLKLDGMHPARSRMRVQILTTGLGRVRPDWPSGTPGPAENLPQVIAPVTAYLDREPIEVTRAVLAPGLTGYYLVDVVLPSIVNYGSAELYIEAGGQASNRVRVYIEP